MRRGLVILLTAATVSAAAQDKIGDRFRDQLGKHMRQIKPSDAKDFFGAWTGDFTARIATGQPLLSDQGQTLSYARPFNSFCERADGTLATLAGNVPCLEVDGVRAAGIQENRLLRTQAFDNAYWQCVNATVTANTHVAPDGTTTADTITTTSAGGWCESTAFLPASVNETVSLYVRSVSGTQDWALRLWNDEAGTAACTATKTATTTWPRWKKRAACATGTAVTAQEHVLRIYPGGVAGSGSIVAWGAQLSDFLRALSPYSPSDSGSTFQFWDNISAPMTKAVSARGCARAIVTFSDLPFQAVTASNPSAVLMGQAHQGYITVDSLTRFSGNDGVFSWQGFTTDVTGRTVDVISRWGYQTAKSKMTVDGVVGAEFGFDGSTSVDFDALQIGAKSNSGDPLYGNIKGIRMGTSAAKGCL